MFALSERSVGFHDVKFLFQRSKHVSKGSFEAQTDSGE